ncbi:hypothetical protein ACTXT7_016765 [Hymenolepis weldensis]
MIIILWRPHHKRNDAKSESRGSIYIDAHSVRGVANTIAQVWLLKETGEFMLLTRKALWDHPNTQDRASLLVHNEVRNQLFGCEVCDKSLEIDAMTIKNCHDKPKATGS